MSARQQFNFFKKMAL